MRLYSCGESATAEINDPTGNESDITFDGIHISEEGGHTLYLPTFNV
jgi:hypothetical protein